MMASMSRITLASFLALVAGFLTALVSVHIIEWQEPQAGVALPGGTAIFETSLQDRITTSDTSMTLVSASTTSGEDVSGYQCFTIDEGRTDTEYVCGTVAGRTVSSLERGISLTNGTTTDATRKFAHRKGANVKVTDYPLIQRMRNQLNGSETVPNLMTYANTVLITAGSASTTLATKYYVDSVSVAGAPDANETTRGIVELATGAEAASSASLGGTGAFLALPASLATDTPQTATRATRVLMSDMTGYLKQGWLNLTEAFTWTGLHTFSSGLTSTGTTTVSASSLVTNPLVLNGLAYTFPSGRAASSTVLMENGSGSLTWNLNRPARYTYATTTNMVAGGSSYATSTNFAIPAGVLTASSTITFAANFQCDNTANADGTCYVYLRNSNGETIFEASVGTDQAVTSSHGIAATTVFNGSVSSQATVGFTTSYGAFISISAAGGSMIETTSALDLSQATSFSVVARAAGGNPVTLLNYVITVNP